MSAEIPAGAMRFNSDSQKLEYWNGSAWFQVHTATPNLANVGGPLTVAPNASDQTPGVRGVFAGGYSPSPVGYSDTIEYVNIASTGNAQDFGDMTAGITAGGGVASRTRGLFAGGYVPGGGARGTIDQITIASLGSTVVFGQLQNGGNIRRAAAGNATRGLFVGGGHPTSTNDMIYVTIATQGDSIVFGDLTVARSRFSGAGSPVRGVFAGGFSGPSPTNTWHNVIDFVNITTIGNAQDFGDLTKEKTWTGSCSNATRMIIGGGDVGPGSGASAVSETEYLTIASGGNAIIFGDLNAIVDTGTYANSGVASPTRGVFNTGLMKDASSTTYHNTIYYVQIATQGKAADFGDLSEPNYGCKSCSNGHGGL